MFRAWFGNMARVLEPGRGLYIWGGFANRGNYPPVLRAQKLCFSQAINWDKVHPVLTRKDLMGAHEWCFYGWKDGDAHPGRWHHKLLSEQDLFGIFVVPTGGHVRPLGSRDG